MTHLRLYEHPLSSYAQKVKIMLREKQLTFEAIVPDSFGTKPSGDAFASASPRHEVPAMVVDGVPIFDSTVICEFVEERWPEPPLLSRDPLDRARARMIEDLCDTQYEAINWGWGEILWFGRAAGDLATTMRANAERQTRILQAWLTERLGERPWFGGESFGWADAAVAPMVNRSVYYGLAPAGPLETWHARVRDRPSVALTFGEFDVAAERMASASELYTTGGRRREYRDHRLDWMIRSGGLSIVEAGIIAENIRFSWPL